MQSPLKTKAPSTQPSDPAASAAAPAPGIAPEINTRLRSLAHDLSNSIETIMQATYLLAQAKLQDSDKRWVGLIDQAGRDAARISRDIREILRSQADPK